MQDFINRPIVKADAWSRLERIAKSEYREMEGQLLAMCDLWERTYGVKQDQIKHEIMEPPKLKAVNSTAKARPKKKVHGNTGRKLSPETKAKLSAVRKGRKRTEEERRKISLSLRGRKQSPESVLKRSHSRKINAAKKKLAELQAMIAAQEKNPETNSGK